MNLYLIFFFTKKKNMGFEMNSVEFDYVCCWNLELDWCVLVVFFVGLVKIINIYAGLC